MISVRDNLSFREEFDPVPRIKVLCYEGRVVALLVCCYYDNQFEPEIFSLTSLFRRMKGFNLIGDN